AGPPRAPLADPSRGPRPPAPRTRRPQPQPQALRRRDRQGRRAPELRLRQPPRSRGAEAAAAHPERHPPQRPRLSRRAVDDPEVEQVDRLRALIAEKNIHYFHYWRPQNDTYIFGFRRKEQGQLTAEFPKYPPILAEKEAEVAKLRVPVAHTYVLERAP